MAPPELENLNISGEWQGSYTTNKVPTPKPVVLIFQQQTKQEFEESRYADVGPAPTEGDTVVGVYKSKNGAIGTMSGEINGGTVTLEATQETPKCPGSFAMQGELAGDKFAWRFSGNDCLGEEIGEGRASRALGAPLDRL